MAFLEINGVRKSFGQQSVVRSFDLAVARGDDVIGLQVGDGFHEHCDEPVESARGLAF